jgi:hypothetical protein
MTAGAGKSIGAPLSNSTIATEANMSVLLGSEMGTRLLETDGYVLVRDPFVG